MSYNEVVTQSITILIVMILLGMMLREFKVLKEEHSKIFANIILNFTLPAMIFSSLSQSHFKFDHLVLALVMIITEVCAALLALLIGRLLKLSRPRLGALILASTFGSSGFLGYALVKIIFPDNARALADAAIVSEFGVAFMLFTFGVFIAMYFGKNKLGTKDIKKEIGRFFYSPLFFSLVLGIATSFLNPPQNNLVVSTFYKLLGIISSANTVLVTLTIGVMLHFRDLRKVWGVVLLAIFIKLIFQPLFSNLQASLFNFPVLWNKITVIEASMPSATMTAIFAKQYNCDSELTTILIFATFISSFFTMVMMVWLL
ncbi:AEC family transporter [Candidatus Sulfidibacterium hydrothermale]|uniref:AEC family transporter n=1 Tax=Candidatus Sulfidibacterium hydrothermale TaxID=2875962 RepID=UPI001F0B45F8|nr:AEC family transporter [Candidatus Sulfidibacterium hydrothermale]UBM62585.1 AEC family transporter [Candidatus Sulfidibacterium hydrothermale]